MIQNGALPDGWLQVRFGDVVSNVNRSTKDPISVGLDRVVGLDHLDPGSLSLRRWDLLKDLPDGTTFTRTFKAGQVLFGKRRAYQRKVAVPDFDGVCSGDILVLEPSSSELRAELLPYVVQSDGFFDHALGTSAGSLSPRTKWQDLARYEFALPPRHEQDRIVEVAAAYEALKQNLVTAREACNTLLRANLRHLLQHVANAPKIRCSDLINVQVGKKLSPEKRQQVRPRSYLRAVNLRGTHIDTSDMKEMDFTPEEDEALSVRQGDVLLVEGGNRDAVGAPTFARTTPTPPLYIQNTIVRMRLKDPTRLDTCYLFWLWRSMHDSRLFEAQAVGTKLYHLGPKRVADQMINVPDLPDQVMWAHRCEAIADLLQKIDSHHQQTEILSRGVLESLLAGGSDVH